MGQIDKRLEELGIEIPTPAAPVANYVGWVRTGNLVFTSGQVPLKDGEFLYKGIVPDECSEEDAVKAARLCAINIIAQLKDACGGDLDQFDVDKAESVDTDSAGRGGTRIGEPIAQRRAALEYPG